MAAGTGDFQIRVGPGPNRFGSTIGAGGTAIPIIAQSPSPQVSDTQGVLSKRVISSMSSSVAFHTTLFEDLGLQAEATYNFYSPNESTSFVSDPSASLGSIPRYVSLNWNPASAPRDFSLSRKGLRPFDPRTPTTPPALGVALARVSVANGYISPGAIQALLVPPLSPVDMPEFNEDVFLSSPMSVGLRASDSIWVQSDFHTRSIPPSSDRIRVNFIDPSIAGALDRNRIAVSSDHIHLASLGAFAKLASGLEVVSEFNQDVPLQNSIPEFPTPTGGPDLMYTGYVIERYTMDPSGSMSLTRTIPIDDPGQSSFIDREVVYGGRYSYRIRSFVQWSHGPNVGFFGSSSLNRSPAFDTSAGSSTRKASFIGAEWSDWARVVVLDQTPPDPPDELTVMPSSTKGQVRVVWKAPNDPRGDIASVTLMRSVGQGGQFSQWTVLSVSPPANGAFIDSDVEFNESSNETYMYAMFSTSFHGLRSVLSERIAATLTDRSRYLGENPVRLVGPRGDDPMGYAHGPIDRVPSEVIAARRVVAYIRAAESSLPLFDRSYVIEVQSLATGERAEITLGVDTNDVALTDITTTRSA